MSYSECYDYDVGIASGDDDDVSSPAASSMTAQFRYKSKGRGRSSKAAQRIEPHADLYQYDPQSSPAEPDGKDEYMSQTGRAVSIGHQAAHRINYGDVYDDYAPQQQALAYDDYAPQQQALAYDYHAPLRQGPSGSHNPRYNSQQIRVPSVGPQETDLQNTPQPRKEKFYGERCNPESFDDGSQEDYNIIELPVTPTRPKGSNASKKGSSINNTDSECQDSLLHIQIYDWRNKPRNSIALLDTGCLKGNWVSTRKVEDLGLSHQIDVLAGSPLMLAVNGEEVQADGTIELEWVVTKGGTRFHSTTFFVFEADHIDVIFGAEFLFNAGVIKILINRSVLAPLVEHKKLSKGEKIQLEEALKRQRDRKLEEEQRRKLKEARKQAQQANITYQTYSGPNRP